ncbi:[FeFe] hydrogenase H-cluster radical SAM maturase HydE [Blautia schinkii]|uniref:[FeFe] hydrogenase H-cluster radical SAM maturase HydE n=1 Tax=Blautia schinkii TaxID=180164 RepID=UPI00156F70E3|nr:[FeFe] hydrogenase H-cluster radical SAM maturase HydE [Blautia schinkii]NSG83682.1 [FeFe] hydrogenase H-cluster radical SAM maturase HydE [Blautia schinkii]NSK24292.1 [FeFe] hydrogenase H-cluster radical SAM maturase HydE [Blautia schinkii]NSK27328.1 [FeFe] hydrogenase H-cluster radical SAM maturase HydE [Blautia schinkii]NSK33755.1 [FeFe] hydrogenase H-cluster radical SAM maturase HydE [Blautia schinkii]NSK50522.1 [FeFe] hydrogenase H-cluster radical SAM maturase HydE [Blautia schinkii]
MGIAEKFIKQGQLDQEEYPELLKLYKDQKTIDLLKQEAVRIQKKYFGNKIYTRGLVEFTNYCRNDCYYCGIRRSNTNAVRYRLTKEEILQCCENGHELGFRTFVLQGGEDPWFNDERMVDIIQTIKKNYPDCAITLSIGEKSKESYRKFREAGADRYLLRHETANEDHYRYLHPENLSLSNRKQCLYDLKELGYQIGAGFMVGAPGQTMENLAEDLVFLKELNPHMVGIGPFIPHHDTKFAEEEAGNVELTLLLLSVIRIMLPKVLLPATTALGTLDPRGREKGFQTGANVVMPNLSPVKNRKQYELYDNKICTGEEAAECRGCLSRRARSVGYEIVTDRGDSPMI